MSREFKKVKDQLLRMLTNFGQPVIVVADGNFENRGELLLRHVHEGTDLDVAQARDTLRNASKLWTRPVSLLTKVENKGKLLRCEDGNLSERSAEYASPARAGGSPGARRSAARRAAIRVWRKAGLVVRLWAWGQTDPGRKRERNEDSYLVDPETGVVAVADGMGGHQGGATASRMAVEYLGRELAEARGDFAKALENQIRASLRTTEEMPVVSDSILDTGMAPTTPRRLRDLADDAPVRGEDTTLPGAVMAVLAGARADARRGAARPARRSSRRRGRGPSCAAWGPR